MNNLEANYGYLHPNATRVYEWLTCKGDCYGTGEAVLVSNVVPEHSQAPPGSKFVGTLYEYTGRFFDRRKT